MDHWGLVPHAHLSLPLVMGAATRRILRAAAPFVPNPASFATNGAITHELADQVPLQIGPFTVTPFLMDHSAYDAYAMLIEAGLSFLGAGVPPEVPSWGNIIAQGRTFFQIAPWTILIPGVFLAITVLAVNLLGDGLRDRLDPRLARRL